MKQKEIRKIIRDLGYKLILGKKKGTIISETFISTIDGEKKEVHMCWSSKSYDWEFLEKVLKNKNLKGMTKK